MNNHDSPYRNVELSKFRPLKHVLCNDDFDRGLCGWMDLKGNHTEKDFRPVDSMIDMTRWGPGMLSSASFGYAGTHGSMDGIYSYKVSTRPVAGRHDGPAPAGSYGIAIVRPT